MGKKVWQVIIRSTVKDINRLIAMFKLLKKEIFINPSPIQGFKITFDKGAEFEFIFNKFETMRKISKNKVKKSL